jgi:hypothetical protein
MSKNNGLKKSDIKPSDIKANIYDSIELIFEHNFIQGIHVPYYRGVC